MISNVHGPVQRARRKELWDELNGRRRWWNGVWCVGSDWHVVKSPSERLGCSQFTSDMEEFLDWIDSHSLIDL